MSRKLAFGSVLALALASTSSALAETVSFSDSIPLQSTNWDGSVTVSKFDTALGILTKVTFELFGHVEGNARFESLDSEPATVTMELAAQLTLHRPDMSTLVITLPLVATTDNVDAFDNVIDFGGLSGKTYTGLSGDDSDMAMSSAPADLMLFSGPGGMPGTITLPVLARGASTGSGAGNLLLQFATSASAEVRVTYEYEIPEPAALAPLAICGLTLARRRRRA